MEGGWFVLLSGVCFSENVFFLFFFLVLLAFFLNIPYSQGVWVRPKDKPLWAAKAFVHLNQTIKKGQGKR